MFLSSIRMQLSKNKLNKGANDQKIASGQFKRQNRSRFRIGFKPLAVTPGALVQARVGASKSCAKCTGVNYLLFE